MFNGIIIDGNEYDMVVSVKRTAKIEESSVSGMMMDKTYYNDPIATYMEYRVSIAIPHGKEYEYAHLYNVITAPVREHHFILPFNNHFLSLYGKIESVSDSYHTSESVNGQRVNVWKEVEFEVVATRPLN